VLEIRQRHSDQPSWRLNIHDLAVHSIQLLIYCWQLKDTYSLVTTHPWGSLNCLLIESGISRNSNIGNLPMTMSSPSFAAVALLLGRPELTLPPMVCLRCCESTGLATFFWEGANDLLILRSRVFSHVRRVHWSFLQNVSGWVCSATKEILCAHVLQRLQMSNTIIAA
jgi:hypothetical protein